MSDNKTDKEVNKEEDVLEIIDVDDFSSVDSVSDDLKVEADSADSSNKEPIIDVEVSKPSFDGDDVSLDAVMEVEEETDADDDATNNYLDDSDEAPETDDFDDLEEEDLVAGSPMAGAKVSKSMGAGKLVVGVLALLSVGVAGYYVLSPKETESVSSVQIPSIEPIVPANISEQIADDVSSDVVTEGATALDLAETDASYMTDVTDSVDADIIDVMAVNDDAIAVNDDVVAVNDDVVAVNDDAIAVNDDVIAVNDDVIAVNDDVIAVNDDVIAVNEDVIDDYGDVDSIDDLDGDNVFNVSEQTADDMDMILSDEPTEIDGESSLLPVSGGKSTSVTVPIPSKKDVYFDSVQDVIQRDSSLQEVGPSEVSPIAEPASKYVIVNSVSPKDSVESKVMQAKRALKLGRYDAAYDFYERLYKINPRDEAILMGRAVSLHELGRKRAAIDAYEDLLSYYPNNADALVNLLGLVKGEHPAVALQRLLSLRSSHPNNDGVVAQIALTYASMNNTIDAKRYMNIAMGVAPKNAQHPYNLAVIYDRDGDTSNAIKYYDMALSVDAIHGSGRSLNREVIYDRLIKLR